MNIDFSRTYTPILTFVKDGHSHIEFRKFQLDDGTIKLEIDGKEIESFTRVSQCCDAPTYAEVTGTKVKKEMIKCEKCDKECLTYLIEI